MRRRRFLTLAGLTAAAAAVAGRPAAAHHKPGHRGGPPTTTSPAPTTTTGAPVPTFAPSTTTTILVGGTRPDQRSYGPKADYTQPGGSVSVAAGANSLGGLQALIDANPAGTVFWLEAGIHRSTGELTSAAVPKTGNEFHFAPGAVVNGSKVLTGWTSDGAGRWFVDGQTQRGIDGPETVGGNPISPADAPWSWKSETVWIDNVIQKAQNSLATCNTPGEWFFDYAANRIYIATDPDGKTVETSHADTFLDAPDGAASNVKVVNATVEKFMPTIGACAIEGSNNSGWQVVDSLVRWNHSGGVRVDSLGLVRGCRIHENGQIGAKGAGSGGLWEENELAYNNTMGIASGFEGGGTKYVFSTGLILRSNWAHHNKGPGLWCDIDNHRALYELNLCEHNDRMGIFHEINLTSATIRWNICRNNGADIPGQGANYNPEGAGITVNGSPNVDIYANTVADNAGGGIVGVRDSRSGVTFDLTGLSVHDNHITLHAGLPGVGAGTPVNGVLDQTGTTAFQPAANNRFDRNTYVVGSLSTTFFQWDGAKTWAQWQAVPQDAAGTATVG